MEKRKMTTCQDRLGTMQAEGQLRNGIFEPFIYKNDHFAKTGSGQT
jgi:hypothetical protein